LQFFRLSKPADCIPVEAGALDRSTSAVEFAPAKSLV
jgi:hypothetical protein